MTARLASPYDPEAIRHSIAEARQLVLGRPPRQVLDELATQLSRDVSALVNVAECRRAQVEPGTAQWHELKSLIDGGHSAVTLVPDDGPLARIVQVRTLSRAALLLLTKIEGNPRCPKSSRSGVPAKR